MDEQTQTVINNLVKSNEWLRVAEYSWRNIAQEAVALLEEALTTLETKVLEQEDNDTSKKIRAFLRRIGKQP